MYIFALTLTLMISPIFVIALAVLALIIILFFFRSDVKTSRQVESSSILKEALFINVANGTVKSILTDDNLASFAGILQSADVKLGYEGGGIRLYVDKAWSENPIENAHGHFILSIGTVTNTFAGNAVIISSGPDISKFTVIITEGDARNSQTFEFGA